MFNDFVFFGKRYLFCIVYNLDYSDAMNKTERRTYDQLKRLYDYVQGPLPRTKWGQKDLFNCWDFMAIDKDGGLFVQVSETQLYNRGKDYKKKLEAFPKPKGFRKQYWFWDKKDKEFRVKELNEKKE